MATKKDPKGKDKSQPSTKSRSSPVEGGFLEVSGKPKALASKNPKRDSRTEPMKAVSASVGQEPQGAGIKPPQKADKWAQKQPPPKSPAKNGKEKLIQSERLPASKMPQSVKALGSKTASTRGNSKEEAIAEESMTSHVTDPPTVSALEMLISS